MRLAGPLSDSDSSDEEVIQQPQVQRAGSFRVEEASFPEFGGATHFTSSSMNWSSASITKAPDSMPEAIAPRRRRVAKPQAAPAEAQSNQNGSSTSSIPWRAAEFAHNMAAVPQWTGPTPKNFRGIAHDDPYAVVSSVPAKPKPRPEPHAQPQQRQPAPAPAPVEKPREKKPPKPAAPKQDEHGFTEVVSKKSRGSSDAKNSRSEGPVKAVGASSAFDALNQVEPKQSKTTNTLPPSKKKTAQPDKKQPASKPKQSKNSNKPVQQQKQQKQPQQAAAGQEQKSKKKSSGKKSGSKKGSTKEKPAQALPLPMIVGAAVFAVAVVVYFAKFS